ncbi:MAG: hypothetical protein SRB2_02971 [Desulfobacteraceae bacterium Eth-SRB2]|nr:MAG: hypothetical protein SRB2_02971 [Desulfobacteraceae bacterium Eth-SRB2]
MADNCDFTMAGLRNRLPEAFAKVTSDTCKGILSKVFHQEDKYWSEDEKLDKIYSNNSQEEYVGIHALESQGEELYLEAV